MTKIAINGFGRIGRLAFRQLFADDSIEIVAVNDLTEPRMLAHLLKYDSVQGSYKGHTVTNDDSSITVDGKKIRILSEKDLASLPWKDMGIDIVLECTGFFASKEKASAHIKAGAKKVVISAPAGNDLPTIVYGTNHHILTEADDVISIGSAQRVPVPSGSITILDATLKDDTETVSVEGINAAMKAASSESFGYTEEELVSSDIIGMEYGSLFDATQTLAERCGTKIYEVRVVAWYDNENSYVSQMVRTVKYLRKFL